MFKILKKEELSESITVFDIDAKDIAKRQSQATLLSLRPMNRVRGYL